MTIAIKQQARRQRIRKGLILATFLLFPIIMNYFSPYVIIDGASQGIVNGSFIVFGVMFLSSLFVGRLWCGWVCPAGGLQEAAFPVNSGRFKVGRRDWIKWFIWTPWIAAIAAAVISAGGYRRIDFFHLTESGVSVTEPMQYANYLLVVGLFVILAVLMGRRAGCHTVCWMAPFMIIGRKIRNLAPWPSLRLAAHAESCQDCLKCTSNCPMSLDVHGMVQAERMEHSECILCGTCVDNCSSEAIRFSFSAGK
jgi:ferredoxin-type protein NapH